MNSSFEDTTDWLLNELAQFNVKIKRTIIPRKSKEGMLIALEIILELAITIPQEDTLAFSAHKAFGLFPGIVMRSLPP